MSYRKLWVMLGTVLGSGITWGIHRLVLMQERKSVQREIEALQSSEANLRRALDQAKAPVGQPRQTLTANSSSELNDLRAENARLKATVAANADHMARLGALMRDPLIDIDGIGPVFEQRLFAAGITTFAQLAQQSTDRVRQVVEPDRWQRIDPAAAAAWIAEARERAGAQFPDPLIAIIGIGPVYEQRLLNAGITTFAQLAQQTPERLREIVKPEQWQDVDTAAWIAEAKQLAADPTLLPVDELIARYLAALPRIRDENRELRAVVEELRARR